MLRSVTRRRTLADWRVLAAAASAQLLLAAAVRVTRLRNVRSLVARARPVVAPWLGASEERTVWAIGAVGRRLPRVSTCLVRALAADLLLSERGHPRHLVVGVRRSPAGALEAHAWLERDGRALVGGEHAGEYVEFARLPARTNQT